MDGLAAAALISLGLAAVTGYLLGSIPFGLLVTKAAGLGDIRAIGSGNIGTTNVLRTGRKELALATLVLDGGKGALAVLLFSVLIHPMVGLVAGAGAFLGHCYPVWLRFRGGKGVATFLGLMLAAALPLGAACCTLWVAVAYLFRFSSLAALCAAAAAPALALVLATPDEAVLAVFCALLIALRHRDNIRRLLAGTEPRIGAAKPSP